MWDANTNTLYSWAFDYPEPESIPASLEMDREKLIEIIDMVESCIGKEFEKDVDMHLKFYMGVNLQILKDNGFIYLSKIMTLLENKYC